MKKLDCMLYHKTMCQQQFYYCNGILIYFITHVPFNTLSHNSMAINPVLVSDTVSVSCLCHFVVSVWFCLAALSQSFQTIYMMVQLVSNTSELHSSRALKHDRIWSTVTQFVTVDEKHCPVLLHSRRSLLD